VRDATLVDDELWAAVGEPSRRRLLDLLINDGEATATGLAQQLPLTRQAVTKHLGVLDRAGLVRAAPRGREVRYRVQVDQVHRAASAMAAVASQWDKRLNAIKRIAETIQREGGERG
jgi:ArsR family transcriptional regulator, cadmium/lead-responsive transcriptional repressor